MGRLRLGALGAAALACCLLLSWWIANRIPGSGPSRAASSVVLESGRGGCEQRIENQPRPLPVMAIVGASYTAGVGPGNPGLSWAVLLARQLHWNAVIDGDPGAGYVKAGDGGRGPMDHLLRQEGLGRLRPALVIVQAGHDDAGVPAWLESRQVGATLAMIGSAAPGARIALLTTFTGAAFPAASSSGGTALLRGTDHAIVTAGSAADPQAIVMDPLTGGWKFPRAADGLHPTAAGDQWIAQTVAAILRAHGFRPAADTAVSPLICDMSAGAGQPAST